MGKYDRVDQLMEQAAKPATPRTPEAEPRDAETVLAAKVTATEPGVPPATETAEASAADTSAHPGAPDSEPAEVPETRLGARQVSPTERGRQLLGALRPFLPVVGSALRMVDHGAAQAIGRMLPALGVVGAVRAAEAQEPAGVPAQAMAALEKKHSEMERDIADCQQEITAHGDKLRKLRESLERSVAEQGTLTHRLNQAQNRLRLMAAALAILTMLVIAEFALMFLYRR